MPMPLLPGWKNNLAEFRKKKGLGQREVARAVGVRHVQTVSHWERMRGVPCLAIALRLAKLYGTTVESLWSYEFDAPARMDQPTLFDME